jgi:hypothetical protein
MTQPTFSDGPPVPLMVEGTLDATGLRQLFADLSTAATVREVREKGGPTEYTSGNELPLAAACDRLLSGAARAIQLRYHFDGHDWTDTIFALPTGYRTIRVRHG